MLSICERIVYFCLFLLNKYVDSNKSEEWLSNFENAMIRKYVSATEIRPTKIPVIHVDELTNERFVKLSNNYRNPVLIKGFLESSNAVNIWDLHYLQKSLCDFKIHTIDLRNKTTKIVKFSDFAKTAGSDDLYINNNHTIFANFPELFQDLEPNISNLIHCILDSSKLDVIHIANLFISKTRLMPTAMPKAMPKGSQSVESGSQMHCGGSGNFFCMIRGRKHWTLIDPKFSCFLKGRVAPSGIHAQTLFEMSDLSLSTFPKMFKHLPRHEIILEPGDVLWNAPWWWHRIANNPMLGECHRIANNPMFGECHRIANNPMFGECHRIANDPMLEECHRIANDPMPERENIGVAIRHNKVTMLNLMNNFTFTLSGYTYLFYNSLFIKLAEVLYGLENFSSTKREDNSDNVLYQIQLLVKKYPKSVKFDQIFSNKNE